MGIDIYKSKKIKKLMKEIQKDDYPLSKKYSLLYEYNLVDKFKTNGLTFFLSPKKTEHKWVTYMFKIPFFNTEKSYIRKNRTIFLHYKNIFIKWIIGEKIENYQKKSSEILKQEIASWTAKRMIGYSVISIPFFLSKNFENNFDFSPDSLIRISPTSKEIKCINCGKMFSHIGDESVTECPYCGETTFLTIK